MKAILSFFLAVAALFSGLFDSLPGGESREPEEDAVPALAQAEAAVPAETGTSPRWSSDAAAAPAAVHEDIDYAGMEYVHYDPAEFYAGTEALRAAADGGDLDAVRALCESLYDEFEYMDTMASLCLLRHNADIYDEYWTAEYAYVNDLWSELSDELDGAFAYALESPCAGGLAEYIGGETADYFAEYEPMTDEDAARNQREVELIDEYYALYDGMGSIVYSYQDEDWTLDRLYGAEGDALDIYAYSDIYYGLQQALCETFAPTYIALAELRREEAASYGYDSYADYAYEVSYCRDYGPAEAQALCDAVKPIAREYYAHLYYSNLAYAAYDVSAGMDGDAMVSALGEYLPRIDPSLREPWEYMTAHGLYDLQPSSPGRFDGGFSLSLAGYGSAFIYDSLDGSCYDFITFTHEFGHFSNFYYNPLPNILLWTDDLDLSEIHSNGLQALFTAFYDEIFGADGCVVEFASLSHLLDNVIEGCIYDEFQRRVYEAENLTAEELNRIFIQVRSEYGLYDDYAELPGWDGAWVYVSHNFETPFYYISYAASALAALQIWDISQSDFQAAADVYMDVLGHGAYAEGYFTVLEECGLTLFTEEGAAESVCRPVLNRLSALDRQSRW